MSNHANHRRGEKRRSEHAPRHESRDPGKGCNSTHVAKSRKKWKRIGARAERRTDGKSRGGCWGRQPKYEPVDGTVTEMPVYDYECAKCGQVSEVDQRISDPPIETCPREGCDGDVKRVITAPANFQLKGSGWFKDGY